MALSALFEEIEEHLLKDLVPSIYLKELEKNDLFKEYPFNMLEALIETPQDLKHHPEGSVWNHVLLVVDEAAKRRDKSENIRAFMWAALLHDIGKGPTTKMRKGRYTSYDHDTVGSDMAREFLVDFSAEDDFIDRVVALVRWHMQTLFVVKDLPFADIKKMLSEVSLEEIALLSLCDRLGRGEMTKDKKYEEEENVRIFKEKCLSV